MDDFSAQYRLAVSSGYKANIVKIGREEYDPLAYYHKGNFPDIEITRPGIDTDLSLLHNKCLMSVNGYIQPTEYSNGKLFIANATENMLKTKHNQIGLLSFNNMEGNLKKTQVVPSMLSVDGDYSYYEKAIITFPEEVGDCFLVLAGYLVFQQSEFFYRVSDRAFAIRPDRLKYMERIFELSRYRNIYSALGIEVSVNNPNAFEGAEVRSNEMVEKFLTLDNTFLVEIPGYSVETNKVFLEHSNVPGNFRTEIEPNLPMVGGYGKLLEYKKQKHNLNKHTVQTCDAYLNNHLFSKMTTGSINMYNDHREVGRTYQLSQAFFLDIKLTKK